MKKVFVVLHCNYGDQGVDFIGVYGTKELAEQAIAKRERDENERKWYDILEEPIQ